MAEGPKIAEAHIDITADISGIRKDLAQVKASLKGVQAPAQQATSKFAKLTAIFAGVTAVLGVVTFAFRAVGMVISGISKLISALATIVKTILVTAFNILKKIVTSVFGVIKGMISLAIAGFKRLSEFVGKSIKVQAEFGQSMARVAALTNEVATVAFGNMRVKALELGKATEFSAGQAADAMGNFAMAGFKVKEILMAIGPTLDLASAHQLDLAEASDITARVMGVMSIGAHRTTEVMDALTVAATRTNQNITDVGEAFRTAGGAASGAGVDLTNLSAAIMVMARKGERGSTAGQMLKMSFLSMTKTPALKFMKSLGISMTDMAGVMRPMPDLIDDMNSAMSSQGLKGFARQVALTNAFGQRSGPAMMKLLEAGGAMWRDYAKQVAVANGETNRIATIQRDTLATSFKIVASAVADLQIAIGDVFEPFIRAGNKRVVGMLNRVARFIRENTAMIQTIIGDFMAWFQKVWKTGLEVAIGTVLFFFSEIKAGWAAIKNLFASVKGATGGFFGELFGLDKIPEGATLLQKVFFAVATAISKVITVFDKLWIELKYGLMITMKYVETKIKTFMTNILDTLDPTFGAMGWLSDSLDPDTVREAQQREGDLAIDVMRGNRDAKLRGADRGAGERERSLQGDVNQAFRGGNSRGQQAGQQAAAIVNQAAGLLGGGGGGGATAAAPMTHNQAAQSAMEEIVRKENRYRASLRDIAARKEVQKARQERKKNYDAKVAEMIRLAPKRRAARNQEEKRKRADAVRDAGGVGAYLAQQKASTAPATTSALGAVGTISTVFGQMTVGVTEEIKMLGELVKLTKVIADNSQTAGTVMA